jgi:hypothetical protein
VITRSPHNPGADKQSNWLPAPAGTFNLTMRLYGAQTAILDGATGSLQ